MRVLRPKRLHRIRFDTDCRNSAISADVLAATFVTCRASKPREIQAAAQTAGRLFFYDNVGNNYDKVKSYRKRQQARGLCICCPRPAEPGRLRCAYHLHRDYVGTRRYRQRNPNFAAGRMALRRRRYLDTGRCTRCGLTLAEQDAGLTKCQNCREKL